MCAKRTLFVMQKELQGTLGAYLHNNRIMDNELCTFMQIPKIIFPEIKLFLDSQPDQIFSCWQNEIDMIIFKTSRGHHMQSITTDFLHMF